MRNRACCSALARSQFFRISKLADAAMSCSNTANLGRLGCPDWCVAHPERGSCCLLSSGEPSNEASPLVSGGMEWSYLLPPVSWVAVSAPGGWGHSSPAQDVEVALVRGAAWIPLAEVGPLRRSNKTLSQQLLPAGWETLLTPSL